MCNGSVNRSLDERTANERPRGIMDHDNLGGGRYSRKCTRDGILPPISSFDGLDWLVTVAKVGGRIGRKIGGQRNDDVRYALVQDERVDASLENGTTAEGEELLDNRTAEALPAPAGCDDRGYMHPSMLLGVTRTCRPAARGVRLAFAQLQAFRDFALDFADEAARVVAGVPGGTKGVLPLRIGQPRHQP